MRLIESIDEMKSANLPRPVVLVPTMGALHEGHLSLVRQGREAAGVDGTVVVSVFVNPTQFGPNEDFDAYPRDVEGDQAKCEEAGADIVFYPSAEEMYPPGDSTEVEETKLSTYLCGESRPVHFGGVCRVVLKLFNLVHPDIAIFGKKDFQQLAIIRRMARDLHLDIDVRGGETVREEDGLAMSSRNLYLEPEGRKQAAEIRRGLLLVKDLFDDGERDANVLKEAFFDNLARKAPLGGIDYVDVVDIESFDRLEKIDGAALMAVAVFFGKSRLIDNIELIPSSS